MTALREIFAKFGIEFEKKPLEEGAKATETFEQKLNRLNKEQEATQKATKGTESVFVSLAKGFLSSGLIAGLALFVQNTIQSTLAQADQARQLGTTTQAMLEWQHVAAATGVPVEVMNSGLQTLAQNMRAVQQGNGDAATTFRRLHVPVRDANRNLRDTGDVMAEAGLAIARIENPTLRARLAVRTFGEAGRQLIPIFEQGGVSVESMREEVRGLLGGNMQEMETQARKVRGEFSRLSLAYQGLSNSITLMVLPAFTWIVQSITWVSRETKRLIDTTYILQAAFTVGVPVLVALLGDLAVAAWATFGPMITAMLPVALGLAAIVLVVDDLYALFNGGDSIIGRFIDSLLGVGQAKVIVAELKQSYEEMVDWFAGAIDSIVRNLARIPGLGSVLSGLGLTSAPTDARQSQRGLGSNPVVVSGPSAFPSILTGGRRPGVLGVGSVQANRGGGRPNDIRVTTQVGNITVETGRDDGEAIATTIQGRLRAQQATGFRNARNSLVSRLTDPTEEGQ